MDLSRWSEIHPRQKHSTDSYSRLGDAPQQSSAALHPHPLYPQNPTSSTILNAPDIQQLISKYETPASAQPNSDAALAPPGVDHYAPHAGFDGQAAAVPPNARQHLQPLMLAGATATATATASYYQDLSSTQQSLALKEAIRQYGVANPLVYASALRPQNGMEQMVAANLNPTLWSPEAAHFFRNNPWKKGPKKTKVVQSAWCEVCKIDCNSQQVLDNHKAGKKHKKNLEKLQEMQNAASSTPASAPAPFASAPTDTTPKPKTAAGKKAASGEQKKSAGGQVRKGAPPSEPGEDLETKKRKLMEGGAPADSVRVCEVCNVACNSQTVFNYHLAGQKHAAQVKKQAEAAAAVKAVATAAAGVATASNPNTVTAS